jgi:plasmid stability protein
MSITLTQEVNEKLLAEAKRRGMSPEALAKDLLNQSLNTQRFHDLDYLAGTWSEREAKDFQEATGGHSR